MDFNWNRFNDECLDHDVFLHIIGKHELIHSSLNSILLIFVKDIITQKTYYAPISHPDVPIEELINIDKVKTDLNNLKGKKWVIDKKHVMHMLDIGNLFDVNLLNQLNENFIINLSEFNTSGYNLILKNLKTGNRIGEIVPISNHLETFNNLFNIVTKIIKTYILDDGFLNINNFIVEPLMNLEKNGIQIDEEILNKHFKVSGIVNGKVFSNYNIYTSTGRPSNTFGGINFSALNKTDGSRKSFISRFGNSGTLVLIDYSAFHPRIIAFLTDYKLDININIYEYLAKLYFSKSLITELDLIDSKKITFRQLYGEVDEKYKHIKYLANLKKYIYENWEKFKSLGYVETPIFKRKITNKHLKNSRPSVLFNYILQSVEGEISIPVLGLINDFLRNRETKPILYTYDSILFDYCFDDGNILNEIKNIMSVKNLFPTKQYFGNNFHEMIEI